MFRDKKLRAKRGYTLLEIMLVLTIISILLGTGAYYMVGNLDLAREQRVQADIQTITTQLRAYEMQNLTMPTTAQGLDALVRPPTSEPKPKRWRQLMQKSPEDPWGRPFLYANPGTRNKNGFDLYSLGKDGVESDDDLGNWEN